MPRTIDVGYLFADESRKQEQSPLIHLVAIYLPDDDNTVVRVADTNYDACYGGNLYAAFPFRYSGTKVSTDGSVDRSSITFSNVERFLMHWIDEYNGLRGVKGEIKTTYKKFLDYEYNRDSSGNLIFTVDEEATGPHGTNVFPTNDYVNTNACLTDYFIIDSYSANEQTITLQLDPMNDFSVQIPRRKFTSTTCYWRFKGEGCGYTGAETTCDKSINQCRIKKNFGGFPGVPENVHRLWL